MMVIRHAVAHKSLQSFPRYCRSHPGCCLSAPSSVRVSLWPSLYYVLSDKILSVLMPRYRRPLRSQQCTTTTPTFLATLTPCSTDDSECEENDHRGEVSSIAVEPFSMYCACRPAPRSSPPTRSPAPDINHSSKQIFV